jgi:AcrR family transcriptional regulator
MSPRPRTVSDEAIFAATARMMGELGPQKLTLARVAREVGLSAATLVQRFGSKRGLLLSFARSGGDGSDAPLLATSRASGTPLRALRTYLLCWAQMASTPRELANHLAFFQIDLADADFLRITRRIFSRQERSTRELVEAAIASGELTATDPARLTRVLLTIANGSLMRWAVVRRGPAAKWLADDIDATLAPHLARPRTTSTRRSRRSSPRGK